MIHDWIWHAASILPVLAVVYSLLEIAPNYKAFYSQFNMILSNTTSSIALAVVSGSVFRAENTMKVALGLTQYCDRVALGLAMGFAVPCTNSLPPDVPKLRSHKEHKSQSMPPNLKVNHQTTVIQ
jgi:hypothetical protein